MDNIFDDALEEQLIPDESQKIEQGEDIGSLPHFDKYQVNNTYFIVLTVLYFIAIIYIQWYHTDIFKWSANVNKLSKADQEKQFFTLMWFQSWRSKPMNVIMKIFTNIVNPEGVVVALIICMFIAEQKKNVFNFFFLASFLTYVLMCLKSIFHDPRPYMVNKKILPLEKYAEYGNPSGHVMMGYIVLAYFFETWIYHHTLHVTCAHCRIRGKLGKRHFLNFIHLLVTLMIFISRMYLGMHTMDQCLFSLFNGFYFHLLYIKWGKEYIDRGINQQMNFPLPSCGNFQCLHEKHEGVLESSEISYWPLFITMIMHVLGIVVTFLLYWWDQGKDKIDWEGLGRYEQWVKDVKRHQPDIPKYKILENKTFYDGSTIAGPTGIMYGVFIANQLRLCDKFKEYFYKNQFQMDNDVTNWQIYCGQPYQWGRIFLFLFAFGGTYVGIKKTVNGDKVVVEYAIKQAFLLFFMMSYFIIYPYIFNKLGWVSEYADMLYVPEDESTEPTQTEKAQIEINEL